MAALEQRNKESELIKKISEDRKKKKEEQKPEEPKPDKPKSSGNKR